MNTDGCGLLSKKLWLFHFYPEWKSYLLGETLTWRTWTMMVSLLLLTSMKISEPLWRDSIPTAVSWLSASLLCCNVVILGATPIILAAIGGHLPLVQVLMLMRFLIISKLKCHQSWVIISPHFSFWSTLGPSWTTRTERQDGLVWCRCPRSLLRV